jgi:hypothetical protein
LIKAQSRKTDGEELFARAFAGKFYLDLPEVISQQINFDEEITEWLQLTIGSMASVGGESFSADDYWGAVEKALVDGAATITSQSSAKEYRFVRVSRGNFKRDSKNEFPRISVVDDEGKQVGEMNDPSLGLLSPDQMARRTTVLRLRGWFDCGPNEFEAEAQELLANGNPANRMARLYEWRTRSSELYYRELEARFRRQEDITFPELMPPSLTSLAHRLHLPLKLSGDNFEQDWEKSAKTFLETDEVLAVLARFSSLPVRLPQVIIDAVSAMTRKERLELLERVCCSWKSPIRLMHVVSLALRCFSDGAGVEIAKKVLATLYDGQGETNFASFKAALIFVNEEVAEIQESKSWSPEIKLALMWMHACRLHDLMRAVGFSSETMCSLFEKRGGPLRSALIRDECAWYDCAHPLRLNRTSLLTHGLARLVAGIEPSALEEAGIPLLIRQESLQPLNDATFFPKLDLLRDPTLARNGLCSILGGDHHDALAPLIGSEGIEYISSSMLKQSVQNDLATLATEPAKSTVWTGIDAVTNNLPIYSDLAQECRKALESFDPLIARSEDFRTFAFIFRAASFQVTHLRDETLRSRYRDHVLESLKRESADGDGPDEGISLERRVFSLVEIGSVLSFIPGDAERSSQEFTAILEKMAEIWPEFVNYYGNSLVTQVWDMPVVESEGWWHLTLSLRAVA